MKKLSKRILAMVLVLIMVLTIVPTSVFATKTDATVTQSNNDVSVTATNSLGAMLTDSFETAGMDPDGDYTITDLTFEGDTATASFINVESCNLVVAVYDETTMQMLTSEVTSVEADSASATVTFTETLPEYFISKAFLLDDDYAPLCKEYTSRRNTTEFVEFMALETTDFEEDKVINLDESEDNNFLVLSDEAQKIKGDTDTNVLVSSDTETNTYVFENIDSAISSLKVGDIFHLDNGDMQNLVVIKVASISIDGTTATIVADDSALKDIFEIVKLDSDELKNGVELDSVENGDFETDAWEGGNEDDPWKETKEFSLEKEFKNDSGDSVKITGTATFTLKAHYKIYVSRKWSEISFIINPSAVVTVTVDGVISERRYKIGHFYFSMYGVTIGVEPEFVFSASANITLTGTWKTQIGFGFNTNDGFVNKSTSPTFEPTVKITGQFYIGFNLAPYLTFVHEAVVDIKFTAEIGITIKASYSNDSGHNCVNCIDGDILWSAKLDIDIAILWGLIDTSNNEQYNGDIWDKKPTKFADFYYSFDHSEFGWGECPYAGNPNVPNTSGVANSGKCGDNLNWTFYKDGELKITGTGAMYNYDYKNRPWKSYKNLIKSVVIGNSVTTIGFGAFALCDSLTSVTIGAGVTTIGDEVFRQCDSLTSIIIPDSVITIGDEAFYYCTSLTSVTIGNSVTTIGDYAFSLCENLTNVTIPDSVTTIGDEVFYNCTSLTSVTIPDSVTTIGYGAFADCTSLTGVTIPDSVTTIGERAFEYCDSLTSVTIPDSITTIGAGAFSCCDSLTSVIIGNSVTTIGSSAFRDCTSLTSVTIGNSVTTIGSFAFRDCTSLISITIPDSVTSIGNYSFYNCSSLTSVTIPDSVTTIGSYAFYYCTSLTSITIPDSVTTIGSYAFYYCTSLTGITIPDSVTTIGDYAFYSSTNLTSVTIPDSVTTIGESAFENCNNLTSVTIPDSVTTIGESAFENCNSLTSVTIPDSVTTIGDWAFCDCESLTSVTIGNGVTTIGDYAFYWCTSLTSVTIPDSVTTIGESAFYYCYSLTSVTIPDSVTTIGYRAFRYCDSLTSVTIPDSVTTIGDYAFESCNNLTSVTMGNSVTTIGDYAFNSCHRLTSLTIGNSVTTIGDLAFSGCDSLTDVYYNGTQDQWNAISIGSYNTPLTSATIHYNISTPSTDSVLEFVVDSLDIVDSGKCGDNLTWTLYNDGTLSITGTGAMYDYDWDNRPWETHRVDVRAIIVGDEVTTIGDYAFKDCSNAKSVTIGNSVSSIGYAAFYGCSNLINLIIPDDVTKIGDLAFYHCHSLTSVTIGNSVTLIGNYAFDQCFQITSIKMGSSVTTIGNGAFNWWFSLKDVYYNGTQEQWDKISVGTGNSYLTDATIHYNSSGQKCFTYGGCVSGGRYTLVTITESMETLVLTNANILYFDQVIANDCGMISTDFLPKAQVEGCVTLLIGDFGNGTEARVITTTTYTAGDINLDASFDGMDSILVACVVSGMLTEEQIGTKKFEIADANLDGVVDTIDVAYLENKGLYLS